MGRPRRLLVTLLAATLALGVLGAVPALAHHASDPTPETGIHPGVQTTTEGGGQCTSNFVFTDAAGTYYLGQAAHCGSTGGATGTNGCTAGSVEPGAEVTIQGATEPGTLVYSSWHAMQDVGEADANACAYNDFALVEIADADQDLVDPTLAHYGGPAGLDTDGTTTGEPVYTYGNSPLRLGIELLSPKAGVSLGTSGGGWTHTVYTLTPGIPGDSGSAVVDAQGRAVGILVTLALAPLAGSNGVTDLDLALAYANDHGQLGEITLADGEREFSAGLLPLGL